MDLKKAFDTVDHAILCHKLAQYGVIGRSNAWIANYLSNRVQKVKFNSAVSDAKSISVGVPQCSILGPLLFIIYLNDLPLSIHNCKVSCYADDTALYTSGPDCETVCENLQDDLNRVSYWLKGNRLSLNVTKTKTLCFSTQHYRHGTNLNLNIDGTPLEQVSSYKYLGMVLDNRLNFNLHIDRLVKKSRQRIGCVGRVRKYITKSIALTLYKSMVLPLFDFGDILYSTSSQDSLARLEIVQNNACRIILRKDRLSHVADMLSELGIMSLFARRDFHLNIYMYKIRNDLIKSVELLALFEPLEGSRNRVTRAVTSNDLVVRFTRTAFGRKCISVSGALSWNQLHTDLKKAKSLNIFKNLYWKLYPP